MNKRKITTKRTQKRGKRTAPKPAPAAPPQRFSLPYTAPDGTVWDTPSPDAPQLPTALTSVQDVEQSLEKAITHLSLCEPEDRGTAFTGLQELVFASNELDTLRKLIEAEIRITKRGLEVQS